ncbi:Mov34/MPN/PAD-1 family protein [Xylophilus sp. Leaf220]|uniref:Mov34/MPN/PAD-1 family protein n=1 Tax=Xylophilus sp. Leaf220 TaxID=1735686 RepID=UPI001443C8D6|nr:Mov34/MPN/PAD-1 family protein [Xylophilus sp. Leaf220]
MDGHSRRFQVHLSDQAVGSMVAVCAVARGRETGGILIGRFTEDGNAAFVLEASAKPPDSGAGWAWFKRGASGLRDMLVQRWTHGLHYLGEWHFHPGGSSEPSSPDKSSMAAIATNERYQCPEPILVILGGRPPRKYDFSVTVFPAMGRPVPLRLQRWPPQN